jgi:hypothetical protein
MGLVEFASVRLVFGSRSEKRRNGERSNGHSQEQDERHHQGSPLVFAALPGEYRGCLTTRAPRIHVEGHNSVLVVIFYCARRVRSSRRMSRSDFIAVK